MATKESRKKRRHRVLRMFFILVLTTVVMATNVLGTVPNNPISTGMRRAFAAALPTEFAGGLNNELVRYELPTLPPAPKADQKNENIFPAQASVPSLAAISTAQPTIPTFTSVPTIQPTPTIVLTPTPFSPTVTEPDLARQWIFEYLENDISYRDVILIERQGDAYVVTDIKSDLGPAKLNSQSWDGENINWEYEVNGAVTTMEMIQINVCGCLDLAYVLDVSMSTTYPDGQVSAYDTQLVPIVEAVPNADYSGKWSSIWPHTTDKDNFAIEKQGDVYTVTSVDSFYGDAIITSQSWDGQDLEWTYEVPEHDLVITMKTIEMDKAGILIVEQKVTQFGETLYESNSGLYREP